MSCLVFCCDMLQHVGNSPLVEEQSMLVNGTQLRYNYRTPTVRLLRAPFVGGDRIIAPVKSPLLLRSRRGDLSGFCRGGAPARSEGRRCLERHPPPRDGVRQLQAARVQAQPSPAGVPSSVYVFTRDGEVETPAVRRDELHN